MEVLEHPTIKGLFSTLEGEILTNFSSRRRIINARRGTSEYGYYKVIDFKHPETGIWTSQYEHIFVCAIFYPSVSTEGTEVNHIDLNKLNNHPSNLERVSRSENRKHAYRTGANSLSKKIGEENPGAKLNWVSVGIIRDAADAGFSALAIAKYFKMSGSMINNIVKNKSWVLHS